MADPKWCHVCSGTGTDANGDECICRFTQAFEPKENRFYREAQPRDGYAPPVVDSSATKPTITITPAVSGDKFTMTFDELGISRDELSAVVGDYQFGVVARALARIGKRPYWGIQSFSYDSPETPVYSDPLPIGYIAVAPNDLAELKCKAAMWDAHEANRRAIISETNQWIAEVDVLWEKFKEIRKGFGL